MINNLLEMVIMMGFGIGIMRNFLSLIQIISVDRKRIIKQYTIENLTGHIKIEVKDILFQYIIIDNRGG